MDNTPCRLSLDLAAHQRKVDDVMRLPRARDQEAVDRKIKALLHDPDFIWEAIGPDGVVGSMTPAQRKDYLTTRDSAFRYSATMIGRAVYTKDFAALGRMVYDQIRGYAEYCAEDES
jgi:hypothetical protein